MLAMRSRSHPDPGSSRISIDEFGMNVFVNATRTAKASTSSVLPLTSREKSDAVVRGGVTGMVGTTRGGLLFETSSKGQVIRRFVRLRGSMVSPGWGERAFARLSAVDLRVRRVFGDGVVRTVMRTGLFLRFAASPLS